jgi:hypothetical protein
MGREMEGEGGEGGRAGEGGRRSSNGKHKFSPNGLAISNSIDSPSQPGGSSKPQENPLPTSDKLEAGHTSTCNSSGS